MTIQQINIGTVANDDTGDTPRQVGEKLNSNFQTASHAASREIGTGAGEVPDSSQGFHVGNFSPANTDGKLTTRMMRVISGTALVDETIPSSNLEYVVFPLTGGAAATSPVTTSSSWKNVSGVPIDNNFAALFVRVL